MDQNFAEKPVLKDTQAASTLLGEQNASHNTWFQRIFSSHESNTHDQLPPMKIEKTVPHADVAAAPAVIEKVAGSEKPAAAASDKNATTTSSALTDKIAITQDKAIAKTDNSLAPASNKMTPRVFRNGADIAFGGTDFDSNGSLSAAELMHALKYPFEGETPEMKAGIALMNKHFETFKMMDNKDGVTLPAIHSIDQLGTLSQLPKDSPLYFHANKDAKWGGAGGFLLGAVPSYGVGRLAYTIAASSRPGLAPLIGVGAALVTEIASTGIGAVIGFHKGREADNTDYENGQKARLKALLYDLNVKEGVTKE